MPTIIGTRLCDFDHQFHHNGCCPLNSSRVANKLPPDSFKKPENERPIRVTYKTVSRWTLLAFHSLRFFATTWTLDALSSSYLWRLHPVVPSFHSWARKLSLWTQFSLAHVPGRLRAGPSYAWNPTESPIVQVFQFQLFIVGLALVNVTLNETGIVKCVCSQVSQPLCLLTLEWEIKDFRFAPALRAAVTGSNILWITDKINGLKL